MAGHSIQVARRADSWSWELIDHDGSTTTAGIANNQDNAMRAAWAACRAQSIMPSKHFPQINIERRPRFELAA